jgi:hypothetical protein
MITDEFAKQKSTSIRTTSNNPVNTDKSFNESWTEGSSLKVSQHPLLPKLGAIGSERRVAQGVLQSELREVDIEQPQEEIKLEIPTKTMETSDDCKHVNSEELQERKNSFMSNCWDFTLLLNGMQIHSKFEDTDNVGL